jgi:hypothetical protein
MDLDKSAWRQESGRKCRETIPPCWRACSYQSNKRSDNFPLARDSPQIGLVRD